MLNLLASSAYPSSYEEDELKSFAEAHCEFFYLPDSFGPVGKPHRAFLQILWPKIEDYRRIWHERRESDYWAAGKAMAADLLAAKIQAPPWPRPVNTEPKPDDEIPF